MDADSLLNQILRSNEHYLAGSPSLLDSRGDIFLVVACADPRLTGMIEPAMGLPRRRAIVIRCAGNRILPAAHGILSSIATAVFIRGARHIFIVGHTDCALASFSAAAVVENFRNAGIPRSAFGDADLREWFGAFSDIRANVLQGIEVLRGSGIMPAYVRIHGLIIDTESGKLEVLFDGDSASAGAAPVTGPVPAAADIESAVVHRAEKSCVEEPRASKDDASRPPSARSGPVIIHSPTPVHAPHADPPKSLAECAGILRECFDKESRDPRLKETMKRLREILSGERNPLLILSECERILREYEDRYPRIPGALEYLKRMAASPRKEPITATEVIRRLLE